MAESNIAENVRRVQENIARAAAAAGRDPDEVTLVAASKTQSAEKTKGSVSGIAWLIIAVVVGAVIFLLAQTGGGKTMTRKLGRNVSEMTGGLMGKRPEDEP